jgi:hypothetical protein
MDQNAEPLSYKGRPLMRKGNIIYYGSMADRYITMLQVLDSQKQGDIELSGKVSIQLQHTDPAISSKDRVMKSAQRQGLWNAMDVASVWLERALKEEAR